MHGTVRKNFPNEFCERRSEGQKVRETQQRSAFLVSDLRLTLP